MRCGHCKTDQVNLAHVRGCATDPSPWRPASTSRHDLYLGDFPDGERCSRCAGTGLFITGMENGRPTGPGGICFRCEGKGRQSDCKPVAHAKRAAEIASGERDTHACCDRVRNDLYDRFGIKLYIG
jgi:hypothetical protein